MTDSISREPVWRKLAFLFLGILSIKILFLCLDSTPAYFLGDSASYLATATINWIPPDRSFVYGFFIGNIAFAAHSLAALVWAQAFLSAISAWLLAVILSRIFRAPFWVAGLFGLLCAIEPLQLLMERFVMTETLANVLFASYLLVLLIYIKRGTLLVLLAAQAVGIALLSIRISFLPEVLIFSVLAPLLSPAAMMFWRRLGAALRGKASLSTSNQVQLVAVHLILSLLVSQGAMTAYENWYGNLSKREPALQYENGASLLADFSPLIEPVDFPPIPQRDAIFKAQKFDRHDPANRQAEHYAEGGLWLALLKAVPDPKQANEVAGDAAVHAIERRPLSAVLLQIRTFASFFDPSKLHAWLLEDEDYARELTPAVKGWLQQFYGVSDPKAYQPALTKRWHLAAYPWYWVVLCTLCLCPALLFICKRRERPLVLLCVTTGWILLTMATLPVDRPTPRYLTSDAWLVLLLYGYAVHAAVRATRTSDRTLVANEQAFHAESSRGR